MVCRAGKAVALGQQRVHEGAADGALNHLAETPPAHQECVHVLMPIGVDEEACVGGLLIVEVTRARSIRLCPDRIVRQDAAQVRARNGAVPLYCSTIVSSALLKLL